MQTKSRSTPAQLQIFENGARSAHAPEISELDPELELKFRSGPTTGENDGSIYPGFFWTSEKKLKGKNSSFEKTQANFPKKKLKKFSKNSQIRQLPPDVVAQKFFSHENGFKKPVYHQ